MVQRPTAIHSLEIDDRTEPWFYFRTREVSRLCSVNYGMLCRMIEHGTVEPTIRAGRGGDMPPSECAIMSLNEVHLRAVRAAVQACRDALAAFVPLKRQMEALPARGWKRGLIRQQFRAKRSDAIDAAIEQFGLCLNPSNPAWLDGGVWRTQTVASDPPDLASTDLPLKIRNQLRALWALLRMYIFFRSLADTDWTLLVCDETLTILDAQIRPKTGIGQTRGAGADPGSPPINETRELILKVLLKACPRCLTIEAISRECSKVKCFSDRTIRTELTRLINAGLVTRPSQRKGAMLTDVGVELARKLERKQA
jgi:hypothetical protein